MWIIRPYERKLCSVPSNDSSSFHTGSSVFLMVLLFLVTTSILWPALASARTLQYGSERPFESADRRPAADLSRTLSLPFDEARTHGSDAAAAAASGESDATSNPEPVVTPRWAAMASDGTWLSPMCAGPNRRC